MIASESTAIGVKTIRIRRRGEYVKSVDSRDSSCHFSPPARCGCAAGPVCLGQTGFQPVHRHSVVAGRGAWFESWTQSEATYGEAGSGHVRNVVKPTLTLYLPGSRCLDGHGGRHRSRRRVPLARMGEGRHAGRRVAATPWRRRARVECGLSDTGTEEEFQRATARGAGVDAAAPAGRRPDRSSGTGWCAHRQRGERHSGDRARTAGRR